MTKVLGSNSYSDIIHFANSGSCHYQLEIHVHMPFPRVSNCWLLVILWKLQNSGLYIIDLTLRISDWDSGKIGSAIPYEACFTGRRQSMAWCHPAVIQQVLLLHRCVSWSTNLLVHWQNCRLKQQKKTDFFSWADDLEYVSGSAPDLSRPPHVTLDAVFSMFKKLTPI